MDIKMNFDEYIEPVTVGNYSVRLLENNRELRQYQDLRYKHLILAFDPEKAKNADINTTDDNIGYDRDTSQLCVFYNNPKTNEQEIVGGYILMHFKKEDAFCKATLKYDLSRLFKDHKYEVLEVTRAVTNPAHRNPIVIALLWEGMKKYMKKYNLHYIIGTMSFHGTDPLAYNDAASYLYHYYRMPEEFMVCPIDTENAYYHEIIPKENLNRDAAINQLPPLLKAFLKLGCEVCTGFYIDYDLKTVETLAFLDMQKSQEYGKYPLK